MAGTNNVVTTDVLGSGFDFDPVTQKINATPIGTQQTIKASVYEGGSDNGTTQSWNDGVTLTRTALGRWTATFDTPHPNGTNYHPTLTSQEQSGNRDVPDITIVQGSKTANGFQYQITTGDNGGTADAYVDTPHTIGVTAPIDLLMPAGLPTDPTLPASSNLNVNVFQDQFFSMALSFTNTTNQQIDNWEALIENVPYNQIPNLTGTPHTLVTSSNPDGTYNHLISSTQPLGPFATVQLDGDAPTPTGGGGTGLSLYHD